MSLARKPRAAALAMALGFSLLLPAPSARADAITRKAKQMSDTAAALFAKQAFVEAADLFEQAYALDNRLLIRLRNAGRSWEEAGRPERALHCFERYLAKATNKKLAADARERIARFRAELAQRPKPAAPTAPVAADQPQEPVSPAPALVGVELHADTPAGAPPQEAEEGEAARLSAPQTGGASAWWIAGGGGAAALVGGAVWLALAQSAANTVDQDEKLGHYAYPGGEDKLSSDRAAVSRGRLGGWIAAGVGTAALGTAMVMILTGDEPEASALQPRLNPGPGWLCATWTF